jgi:activating signal cointegrator 1
MRAISLWQPWATFMINGHKQIETRHWSINHRGSLLIHAAKNQSECDQHFRKTLPFGAILGKVDVIDCVPTEELIKRISQKEAELGNYEPGRFGWVCDNVMIFSKPIPYKGQQGLFDVPDEIIKAHILLTEVY